MCNDMDHKIFEMFLLVEKQKTHKKGSVAYNFYQEEIEKLKNK